MQGPDLGVQADDMDLGEPEHEEKQEVLENKDVRWVLCDCSIHCLYINVVLYQAYWSFHMHFNCLGCSTTCAHRWSWKNKGRHFII